MHRQNRNFTINCVIILILFAFYASTKLAKHTRYLFGSSSYNWVSQLRLIEKLAGKESCARVNLDAKLIEQRNKRCGYHDLFSIRLGIEPSSASEQLDMSDYHLFQARLYIQTVKFSVINLFNVNFPGLIDGRNWPPEFKKVSDDKNSIEKCQAVTMIGMRRIDNVQFVLEDVIQREIEGDFMEAGVWKGGVGIFARAILTAYKQFSRRILLADSFEGIPASNVELFPVDKAHIGSEQAVIHTSNYTGGERAVRDRMNSYFHIFSGPRSFARNENSGVQFVENPEINKNQPSIETIYIAGYFKDSLPKAVKNGVIKCLAVLRLDGDLYESTWQSLENLYPYLNEGGVIIVDDFTDWIGAFQAVHDFRTKMNIQTPIIQVYHGEEEYVRGVYFTNPHRSKFC